MINTRAICAKILFAVLDEKQSLSNCFVPFTENLNAAQKGQCQDFCYGVLRQYAKYNYCINQLTHSKLKPDLNQVRYLIAIGMYQLDQNRVADHAAIAETVEGCRQLKLDKLTGLVNAVLREYQREYDTLLEKLNLLPADVQTSHPAWLSKLLKQAYPKGWKKIIKANVQQAPMWLRVNVKKQDSETFQQTLRDADISFHPDKNQAATLLLEQACAVEKIPGFFEGSCSVQDKAAQQAALLLAPKAGEKILDACAAPGGKSAHILELANDIKLDALDIDEKRLTRVADTLNRLQMKACLIAGDASKPENWWDGQQYDRILLDAPCSATGVIRRHPDILYLRREDDIAQLADLQKSILQCMWPLLKPGGTLLYATCSVLPQENKQQITTFLGNHPDAELIPIFTTESIDDPGWQILPGSQNMDGFYYARLRKKH
ncbi:16S rRNA (cytosine(967)-C(5))-methyltransferase RsmB [Catenovulum sediminis]|uniref:16S rRNA (cytosine(967)-C(5))-methyltransferase n=1 Tax=Catenovulum sediminis TaxID=1740262 RepID=A0ABV1RDZ2_9ALTE